MMFLSDLIQALSNLRAQKTRTLLTTSGIVFGVGSVIGMMAIGAGAREETLRFIELLGVRNILVDSLPASSACLIVPVVPPSRAHRGHTKDQQDEAAQRLRRFITEPANSETES
jgi:hypothetical protein